MIDQMIDRKIDSRHIPPHSLDAERSVIGALLLDNSAFHKVVDVGLESQDFYLDSHGKIFQTIQELNYKNQPVDFVTLGDALKNKGILEHVGGLTYLTGLFENSYSSAHIVHYSKIVKEKAILRRIISTANDLSEKAHDGVEDVELFLDEAEKSIFDITDAKIHTSFADIKQVMMENMSLIQELAERKTTVTGLPTGFTDIDEKTSGLHAGQLIVIAGRPAMGKTSFMLNIAEHAAIHAKATVALFSLEMSKDELGFRFLTSQAKVNASKLKIGKLQERDWKNLAKAASTLSESKIMIDDSAAISVLEMRARCRRLQAEHGLGLIIVDYLQLMKGNTKSKGGSDSREREISEISRSLKALAKELKVPVIALSQLNRGLENRPDKRPMLSDLRESGAIEQDADIVAFVYRDEVYNKDTIDKGIAEIIVAKHRAGSVGTVRLAWLPEYTTFSNLAPEYMQQQIPAQSSSVNGNMAEYGERPQTVLRKQTGLDLPNF